MVRVKRLLYRPCPCGRFGDAIPRLPPAQLAEKSVLSLFTMKNLKVRVCSNYFSWMWKGKNIIIIESIHESDRIVINQWFVKSYNIIHIKEHNEPVVGE